MEAKKKKTLRLFLANRDHKFTACQINRLIDTADARKIISRLRQEGHVIKDEIINKHNGTKQYWYERNNNISGNN